MKSTPAAIAEILSALEQTPAALQEFTVGCPPVDLTRKPDKAAWSAQEILAHLRACANLWTHSIYAMLAEADPVLPDINERKYARAARYAEIPFPAALESFRAGRENLLHVLHSLPAADWERGALILGRRHTIFTQARRMAKHEAEHLEQIAALLR